MLFEYRLAKFGSDLHAKNGKGKEQYSQKKSPLIIEDFHTSNVK